MFNFLLVQAEAGGSEVEINPGESCEIKNTSGTDGELRVANSGDEYYNSSNRFDYIKYNGGGSIADSRYKDDFNPYKTITINKGEILVITVHKEAKTSLRLTANTNFEAKKVERVELFKEIEVEPGESFELKNFGGGDGNLEVENSGDEYFNKSNKFDYIKYDKEGSITGGKYKDDYNPYKTIGVKPGEKLVITVHKEAQTALKLVIYSEAYKSFEAKKVEQVELFKTIEIKPGESFELKNSGGGDGNLEVESSSDEYYNQSNRFDYIKYDAQGNVTDSKNNEPYNPYKTIKVNKGEKIQITVNKGAQTALKLVVYSEVYNEMLGIKKTQPVNQGSDVPAAESEKEAAIENVRSSVNVTVNGYVLNFDGLSIVEANGRLSAPLPKLISALGAEMTLDEIDRIVTIAKDGIIIRMPIGSNVAYKNNAQFSLGSAAQIMGGTAYADILSVCELLEAAAEWNKAKNLISVKSSYPQNDNINPISYKEVRYLPATDEIYIRADLNPIAGEKAEGVWPVVWLGVYDEQKYEWHYTEFKENNNQIMQPKLNSEFQHLRKNVYEKYIPASSLPRNKELTYTIFVDGYNTIKNAFLTRTELKTIPISLNDWDVWYNWSLNKLEAVVNYIPSDNTVPQPEFYLVTTGEDDTNIKLDISKRISEIYNGPVVQFKGKYYRAWSLEDISMSRGGKYSLGVAVKGFENQLTADLLHAISIENPEIVKKDAAFDYEKKALSVWSLVKGVPSSYSLTMTVGGTNTSKKIPFRYLSDASSLAEGKMTFGISEVGLKMGNSYNIYIEIRDENGNVIDYTKNPVTVVLKEIKKEPAAAIETNEIILTPENVDGIGVSFLVSQLKKYISSFEGIAGQRLTGMTEIVYSMPNDYINSLVLCSKK